MIRDLGALIHEQLGLLPERRYVLVTRPLRISLQPQRLLLVICARAGPQLRLKFPPIVVLGAMRRLALDFWAEVEKGLGNGESGLDLVDADAVVYEREESCTHGGVNQLLGNFIPSIIKIWR